MWAAWCRQGLCCILRTGWGQKNVGEAFGEKAEAVWAQAWKQRPALRVGEREVQRFMLSSNWKQNCQVESMQITANWGSQDDVFAALWLWGAGQCYAWVGEFQMEKGALGKCARKYERTLRDTDGETHGWWQWGKGGKSKPPTPLTNSSQDAGAVQLTDCLVWPRHYISCRLKVIKEVKNIF